MVDTLTEKKIIVGQFTGPLDSKNLYDFCISFCDKNGTFLKSVVIKADSIEKAISDFRLTHQEKEIVGIKNNNL